MAIREERVDLPDMGLVAGQPFGIYVHVPFCITRCGYCDFNTYTPAELGGVNPDAWLSALGAELELAAARLQAPPVNTVFVGGGTPSLLGGPRMATLLGMVRQHFTLAPDAEVTTEANPESAWPDFFDAIRAAGYTRVSLGMQSVAPRVLGVLDRIHTPNRSAAAAREALAAGTVLVEQAEVILMHDCIENFLAAQRLSRRARAIIRQNLTISLGVVIVMVIATAFGAVPLATGLLTVPIATLTGIAFGAPLFAYAAAQREDRGQFAVVQRVLVLPLTLFSGTLFPLEQLPVFLRPIGWVSPLWHGAELGRVTSCAAERPGWIIAVHLAFLLILAIGGWRLAVRVTRKRLDA